MKQSALWIVLATVLSTAAPSVAQIGTASATSKPTPLTNTDIVRFVKIGLAEPVALNLINEAVDAHAARFDLSPSAIADLTTHGVSSTLIEAMRRPPLPAPPLSPPPTATHPAPALKTTLDLSVPGIQPLDADTLRQALNYGETKGPLQNHPWLMRANEYKTMNPATMTVEDAGRFAKLMDPMPFNFFISSPYSYATLMGADAKRRYDAPPSLIPEQLNARQVIVHVGPSDGFSEADAVENVVIKRGRGVIQPVEKRVSPLEIRNRLGGSRTVSEGDFSFPFSAFDPSAPITLVVIGTRGNVEWPMTPTELARLK